MALNDTQSSYGGVSRFNHWIGAIIVITMLAIGLYFHEMPRGDTRSFWLAIHISIGATTLLLIAFRVIWRLTHRTIAPAPQAPIFQTLSKLIHGLLILCIAIMFISGPLTIWSGGHAIDVFGWFSIPSPMNKMHDLHELLEEVHEIVSRVLLVTIIIHVLAVLKHLVTRSNALRGRMWGRGA